MLTDLRIQHLATIRDLTLHPAPGLNALTGETGAGKSIVAGALTLIFGQRASRDVVRTGSAAATVTARFDVAGNARACAVLESFGIPCPDGVLVVKREVGEAGRNRVFVNGDPATQGMLAQLAPFLGAVHGQHESLELLHSGAQLSLLDAHAGLEGVAARVLGLHAALAARVAECAELAGDERERLARADLLSFQAAEIDAACLAAVAPGEEEDERLRREHQQLVRAEELVEAVAAAAALIHEDEDAAAARTARAIRRLEAVAGLDPALDQARGALTEAQALLQDAGRALSSHAPDADGSAERLASLGDRLAELQRLQRKYGPTLRDVRAHLARAREELARLEQWEERREDATRRLSSAAADYAAAAVDLSRRRRAAAPRLAAEVEAGLARLGMPGSRFLLTLEHEADARSPVSVDGRAVRARCDGVDQVRVEISTNPGEAPRPLGRVVSGGELSRLMLVLLSLVARRDRDDPAPRTWVFDEVDAGVGGEAAAAVAGRLGELARAGDQVFVVTHLARVAAAADAHWLVSKRARAGRTETQVTGLGGAERVAEVARMLSGRDTAAARRHAAELLGERGGARATAGAGA